MERRPLPPVHFPSLRAIEEGYQKLRRSLDADLRTMLSAIPSTSSGKLTSNGIEAREKATT
eukprot:10292746-Lingulodinium_polyedra.AAC.1